MGYHHSSGRKEKYWQLLKKNECTIWICTLVTVAINSCTEWVFSVIGQFEFSVSSQVFVCPNGKMLHSFARSPFITVLEKLSTWWCIRAKSDHWSSGKCEWKSEYGTLISAASCTCWRQKLAERQSRCKAVDIRDCLQWAEPFTARIIHKYKSNDEVCLIFNRYD